MSTILLTLTLLVSTSCLPAAYRSTQYKQVNEIQYNYTRAVHSEHVPEQKTEREAEILTKLILIGFTAGIIGFMY